MNGDLHRNPYKRQSTESTEEIIGVLTAISVVSKRMAKKLSMLEQMAVQKKGGRQGVKSRKFTADAN